MHPLCQGAIDEIGVLPDVGRTRSAHRTLDVDEIAGEKDPGAKSGIEAPRSQNRSVIEAVNAAPAVSLAKHRDDDIHGSGRFQLDVNVTSPIDQAENLGKIRRIGPAPDLTHLQRRNQVVLVTQEGWIVVNDGYAVARELDVKFDSVDSQVECAMKRGDGVFRRLPIRTAMRNYLEVSHDRRE